MGWKLFAVVMTTFFLFGLREVPRDALDMAAMPIDCLASIGLLAYAFGLRQAGIRFWKPSAWAFAAWSISELVVGAIRGSERGSPAYAIVGGLSIVAAIQYFNWLALHRLGRARYA